jgi:tripartite-type tricarboxylate transporter receptor subunit TctC
LGYDIEFYLWVGLFAPKGTPEAIVTKIRDFTRAAVMTPKFKELMANIGQDVDYLDQAEFRAFWDADAKRVEDAVRSIGRVEG